VASYVLHKDRQIDNCQLTENRHYLYFRKLSIEAFAERHYLLKADLLVCGVFALRDA
jgi:hypothetical protein